MAEEAFPVELGLSELRIVTEYAVECASSAIAIFEGERPHDPRPQAAIEAARTFADGARRRKALRDSAWAAQGAAHEAREDGQAAASEAARAAMAAAGAAFLHPIAKATQVKHILGAAAHAARAFELLAGGELSVGREQIERSRGLAPHDLVTVLKRYPLAPAGGGRVGELIRQLDAALR